MEMGKKLMRFKTKKGAVVKYLSSPKIIKKVKMNN